MTASGFVPEVAHLDLTLDARTAEMVQTMVDAALKDHPTTSDSATVLVDIPGLYACKRAVEPHQDLDGAEPGMRVYGLVIRSDGHRLHSRRLEETGVVDGLPLIAGDLYQLDPYDEHWTTVSAGVVDPQLVFYVDGSMPSGQSNRKDAKELLACVMDDVDRLHRDDRAEWSSLWSTSEDHVEVPIG